MNKRITQYLIGIKRDFKETNFLLQGIYWFISFNLTDYLLYDLGTLFYNIFTRFFISFLLTIVLFSIVRFFKVNNFR